MNQTPKINSLEGMREFLSKTLDNSNFEIRKIAINSQNDWRIENGVLSHNSGGFFHVCGLENRLSKDQHLVLYQPQSALTGLALFKEGNEIYLLLQARVEPGNVNIAQYGPTIQSTSANYNRLHGGKATSCLQWFNGYNTNVRPLGSTEQLDLGSRYYLKTKTHSFVELASAGGVSDASMAWVSLRTIFSGTDSDYFLNTDLRSLLATFDWNLYLKGEGAKNENNITLNQGFFKNELGNNPWELISIDKLRDWRFGKFGIEDLSNTKLWVDIYETKCRTREKDIWSQPLFSSKIVGEIILVIRKTKETEFLIQFSSEIGTSGQQAILPSFLSYEPESRPKKIEGKVLKEICQSEEGGRFYKNINKYKIIEVSNEFNLEEGQFWVSERTLKQLLKTSNKMSIELRCICSLILDYLNPQLTY